MNETNYDHYKEEFLIDKCASIRKYRLKTKGCGGAVKCIDCKLETIEWLKQPYEEPVIEIDWSKVPVDTPVICTDSKGIKYNRYFEKFENKVYVFNFGLTSWSALSFWDLASLDSDSWDKIELAREDDIEKYRKQ